MPVCARCGEIAARCTCVTARSAATTPLLEGHRDRWTTRYNSPTLQVDDQLFAGSILDKASGDHRCASCERAFIADETLFPWQDTLLCRSCFARDHSKGVCEACGRQVLDGSFTQAEERIWHSTCYRCVYCRSTVDVCLDQAGEPACGDCFDSAAYKNGTSKQPQKGTPAVEELRHKLAAHGLQPVKPIERRPLEPIVAPQPAPSTTSCTGCTGTLGSDFLDLPSGPRFHAECFKCSVCSLLIDQPEFIQLDQAYAHPQCERKSAPASPSKRVAAVVAESHPSKRTSARFSGVARRVASTSGSPVAIVRPANPGPYTSTRTTLPKLGGSSTCPACGKAANTLDRLGPQGRRYHQKCLVCTGCSKGLDSAARLGADGRPACRACLDAESAKRWAVTR